MFDLFHLVLGKRAIGQTPTDHNPDKKNLTAKNPDSQKTEFKIPTIKNSYKNKLTLA